MKKITVILTVMLLSAGSASAANLLQYGGFEYGVCNTQYSTTSSWFGSESGTWHVKEVGGSGPWILCDGYGGIEAPEGGEFAHIGDSGLDDAIAQTFSTTIGNKYTLGFWQQDFGEDSTARMNVLIEPAGGGTDYLNETYSAVSWMYHTDTFTATATSSVIVFDNIAQGNNIDAVSIINSSIIFTETGGDTSVNEENETSDTFTVKLSSSPTSNVTLTLDPDTEIRLNAGSAGTAVDLTFTTANWNAPQTVTVTAIDDQGSLAEIGEGIYTSTIVTSATTDDTFYAGLNYSDFDIDVEVIDASNRFYHGFTVSSMTGQTPWQWEKSTYADPGGVDFNTDGTIEPPGAWMADWVVDVHKYGAKALMNVGNYGYNNASFDDVVDNADGSRDTFVSSLVAYILDNGLDGINFDIEWSSQLPVPWLDYNLCLVELRAALGSSYQIRCNVYGTRHEIKSNGFAAIDAVDIMSYQDFSQMTYYIDLQKSYGASDSQIHGGMATGYGTCGPPDYVCGLVPALAAQKTQYCLDNGYGGVFLFSFDTEDPATSMLLAVRDTIINYYYDPGACENVSADFDGLGFVDIEDFALLAARWQDAPCGRLNNCCDGTDLSNNGVVDLEDAAIFMNNWLISVDNLLQYPSFEYFDSTYESHYYHIDDWLGGVEDTWQVTEDNSGWGIVLLPDGWTSSPVSDGYWNCHIAEGGSDGAIAQTFATVPGQQYSLSFWHEDFDWNQSAIMNVTIGQDGGSNTITGTPYLDQTFTAVSPVYHTATFTATAASSVIEFDNVVYGNTIDEVSIVISPN